MSHNYSNVKSNKMSGCQSKKVTSSTAIVMTWIMGSKTYVNCTRSTTLKALQEQLLKDKPCLKKGKREAIQAVNHP